MGQTCCQESHDEATVATLTAGKVGYEPALDLQNKEDVCDNAAEDAKAPQNTAAIIAQATEVVEGHMRDFDLDAADAAMGQALEELDAAADLLKATDTYRRLQQNLGHYERAKELLLADGFELLWQQDKARMEVKRDPSCRVFEYRLVIELDQPLHKAMAAFEEVDLVHQVQKQLTQPVRSFGACTPWWKALMSCFNVGFLKVEMVYELFRYRGRKDGFIIEGVHTEFDHSAAGAPRFSRAPGLQVPAASWRTLRPWALSANLWKPAQDDSEATTFVHVSRAETGYTLPQWVLDMAAYFVARGFAADVQKSASEASKPGSAWMDRARQDKDGFYHELQLLEQARRRSGPWDDSMLDRCWHLPAERQNHTPPSLRGN
ncbi:unnamed protein product [Effrenium voratum]|uniref:Uncharacterized protein n=1 Tax=Effrenium voratum TaxID=2562239 RepID=A0AA36HXP8_9DINO|nr:unnamed protein product [Effrenium voratum]